jgi:hypothetical protein
MNTPKFLQSKSVRLALAISAAAIVVTVVAIGGSGTDIGEWRSQLAGEPSARDTDRGDEAAQDARARAQAVLNTGGATSGSPTDGSGSGDAVVGEGSDSGTTGSGSTPGSGDVRETLTVRIKWWNDTVAAPPVGIEVVLGDVNWKPSNVSAEAATGRLSSAPLGSELFLDVYPDGRDGKRVRVPVELLAAMLPDSEEDAIHVAVSDDTVRVIGTPVLDFDVSTPRF